MSSYYTNAMQLNAIRLIIKYTPQIRFHKLILTQYFREWILLSDNLILLTCLGRCLLIRVSVFYSDLWG